MCSSDRQISSAPGRIARIGKLICHVNRKVWWHVPPRDPRAYLKRGKFYSASFREAEFWGRPLDVPEKVMIAKPLVGDEQTIEKELFGRPVSREDMEMKERWDLDAKIKRVALTKGFDSIVLLTPRAFSEFVLLGKIPRSMELNILKFREGRTSADLKRINV